MKCKITPVLVGDDAFCVEEEHTIGDITTRYCSQVVELKDKAIRETLIKLGWTPPVEGIILDNLLEEFGPRDKESHSAIKEIISKPRRTTDE